MKKILFVHPALVMGGAETVLINYLNLLNKYQDRYKVEIVFVENRENFNLDKIPNEITHHFLLNDMESEFLVFLNASWRENPDLSFYVSSWDKRIKREINLRLLSLLNKNNYDIIINFHHNLTGFDDFLSGYDLHPRIKVLSWIHSQFHLNRYESSADYYKYILDKYTGFITLCNEMTENCKRVFDKLNLQKPIYSLFNPCEIEKIRLLSEGEVEFESDKILLEQDFILQVSRLDETQKNHIKMLEIYADLKQKGIKEKLYFVGDGPSKQLLLEKIQSLGLEEDCLLLGQRKNPYIFMKKAKLFLHTAYFEGLPTVLIESMVCGTPVITFACRTGPKDILENGKYGELISMGDEKRFVEKAYELLTNETKRQYFIDLLPEAVERFRTERIATQLIDIVENIS